MLWPLNWNLRHHKSCWLILHSMQQLGFFEITKRPKNYWQLLVKVTYDQVWWSILGICALHLTHTRAHTLQWTHTLSSGQPFMLQHPPRAAVGGSVPCSRAPQSCCWRWRERCTFTPPTYNSCRQFIVSVFWICKGLSLSISKQPFGDIFWKYLINTIAY